MTVETVGPDTGAVTPLAAAAPLDAMPLAPPQDAAVRSEAPAAAAPTGIYVQLGAFGNPDNARKLLSRAREALALPPGLAQIVFLGNLHRVNLGPFADRGEAGEWVAKSNAALGTSAITVMR